MSLFRKGSRKGESAPLAAGTGSRRSKYDGSAREERHQKSRSYRRVRADLVNSTGYQGVRDIPGAPNDRRWYHGGISDNEAQLRLKDMEGVGERGVYLVFDNPEYQKAPSSRSGSHSSQHNDKARYILMLLKDMLIFRWYITRRSSDGLYVIGDDNADSRGHSSVRKLIEYHRGYTGKPLPLVRGGRVVLGDYCYVGGEDNSTRWSDYCCW